MMTFRQKWLFPLLFGLFLTAVPLGAKHNEEELQTIALLASNILLKQHYVHLEPNVENSKKFFMEYLDRLDPQHMFFTREDIRKWESASGGLFRNIINGHFEFAYLPFQIYRERLNEYAKFASELTFEQKDFLTNDTYFFDRSKSEWPADRRAMYGLWHKKIKNDVLSLMLLDRIKAEEAKKKAPVENVGAKKKEYHSSWENLCPMERVRKRIGQIVTHVGEMEKIDILEIYINALAAIYDPHTSYMSPRTEEDFNIQMRLSLTGIGAVLTSEDGYTCIVQIMPDSPSEKDGRLQPGDRIIAVQQEKGEPADVIDMPLGKVVSLIRGNPGTKVTLTVLPQAKSSGSSPIQIQLTRSKVVLKESEVTGQLRVLTRRNGRKQRIGVITVPSFYIDFDAMLEGEKNYKSTTRDFKKVLESLRKQGPLDALVVDLRSNGGGSLFEAITLTGLFIKEGPVVQIRGSDGSLEVKNDEDDSILYGGPLVVMINRYSASASEIFAAALKDYNRAVIVGDCKSHGKGTVQTMRPLKEYVSFLGSGFMSGSIKLTCSKFYRVNGESTQKKGISPDVVFPSFTDAMEIGEEKLKNSLPWDVLSPAKYHLSDKGVAKWIPSLVKESGKRLASDPEYQVLVKDIEFFRKNRNKKELSLNLEKRWKEYCRDKNILDEQEKLLKLESVNEKQKNRKKDLYLQETLNIASDLAEFEHPPKKRNIAGSKAKK